MSSTLDSGFDAATAALAAIPMDAVAYTELADTSLLDLARRAAALERFVRGHAALIAGEIDRRSHASLGHAGLAKAAGFRTSAELIRSTTGSTARDAVTAVTAGVLAHAAAGTTPDERPWLTPVGAAVVSEGLAVAAAESIANGLGTPTDAVSSDQLAAAAVQLCDEANALDADRLFARARALRNEIDAAGIADREREQRDKRAVRLYRGPGGMSRLTWDMDAETSAVVTDLFDRATSPRRGGPRFIDPIAQQQAALITDDSRTTEQLASDVFLELLRQGAAADSSALLNSGAPSVRVIVHKVALTGRAGSAILEGQPQAVSIETAERLACAGSRVDVTFFEGQPLDVGREQRLYTHRQRIALAVRDGGCRWPGCDCPPSWTEAHHINHWERDGGRTDVADGILLCRFHHLLSHNNGWEIRRDGADYWLVPPPTIDPEQRELTMPPPHRLGSAVA